MISTRYCFSGKRLTKLYLKPIDRTPIALIFTDFLSAHLHFIRVSSGRAFRVFVDLSANSTVSLLKEATN
jgi:hypothetical protein